jgi:hypothetical protein
MPLRIAILLAVAALLACARAQPVPILVDIGAENRGQLLLLRPGMTRGEVLELMETSVTEEYLLGRRAFDTSWDKDALMSNPYRTAQMRMDDGSDVELLFYYTGSSNRGEAVTDDELTPLVLVNDTLVGWGWSYLDQNVWEYRLLVGRR